MPELVRINKLEDLKPYETNSKATQYFGVKSTVEMPLVLKWKGQYVTTNEWFINHLGELIFDVEKNLYASPDLYANRESVVEDIYIIVD